MMRFFSLALGFLILLAAAKASGGETLPYHHALEKPLQGTDTVLIDGIVEAASPVTAVLRIDDALSRDYAGRANLERSLPPGPFHWELGAQGLRSTSGRLLDLKSVRELWLFAPGGGTVTVNKIEVRPFEPLAAGALAYSFGAEDAPVFPGFERVTSNNPMIAQGHPAAVRRPGPDPLLASGISGIEALVIPWQGTRARVTLWTEDPGDWETLPHFLERRIRVYGKSPADILYERFTPDEWYAKRYLRGLAAEHGAADDAWSAYGRKRGGLISFETDTGPQGIRIELAGDSPASTFLNAIVAEPAGQSGARDEAEARRAAWYRSTWPVIASASEPPAGKTPASILRAVITPGTGAHLSALAESKQAIAHPGIILEAPALGAARIEIEAWAAQRRLERQGASGTTLSLSDDTLRADLGSLPLPPGEPRRYDFWVSAPEGAPPGLYRGAFTIAQDPSIHIPIEIEVLPVTLPPASKAAGFYLDEAPQWDWFWGLKAERRREQLACDLRVLGRLGITGNAPALAPPFAEDAGTFLKDMQTAADAHTQVPWLAYAAAKRVAQRVGPVESADVLAAAEVQLKQAGLVPPVWSVADEPGNAAAHGLNVRGWVEALRERAPGAKLGAQLNSPADWALAPLFDVAIVNQGFGIDAADLSRLNSLGTDVWLYNTGAPRVTAGLWLWLTKASRYVQWHARIPAADPFDPLDGREADVQIFLPSVEACPARPNLNRAIFDMAEGVTDQRWLLWLEAQHTAEARALARDMRRKYQGRFAEAAAIAPGGLDSIRAAIIDLARKTKTTGL